MATSVRSVDQAVKVQLLDLRKDKSEDKEAKYHYQFSIETNGSPMGPVANYRLSERVKYWSGVIHDSLMECVALKPNSDMGLCQLVRVLYRYGTLPESMRVDGDPKWRRRAAPDGPTPRRARRRRDRRTQASRAAPSPARRRR